MINIISINNITVNPDAWKAAGVESESFSTKGSVSHWGNSVYHYYVSELFSAAVSLKISH